MQFFDFFQIWIIKALKFPTENAKDSLALFGPKHQPAWGHILVKLSLQHCIKTVNE